MASLGDFNLTEPTLDGTSGSNGLVPATGTAAVTASASTTNALGAAITKLLQDPKTIAGAGQVAGSAFGVIENLFGIQTPEQKAAAAAAAAAQQQQQTTMLLVGGGIAVVVIGVVIFVVVKHK